MWTALMLSLALALPLSAGEVTFRHQVIDPLFRSEGVAVADFDRDGQLDIAAGTSLYLGPDWRLTPLLGEAREFEPEKYSDSFLCFAADLNGDGWMDLVQVGFPNAETAWLANPGAAGGVWQRYPAIAKTGGESPWWTDLDGDGRPELVFMAPAGVSTASPGADPTQPWPIKVLGGPDDPKPGHGLGIGDVNGDGRADVLCPGGWWSAPKDRNATLWPFHAAKLSQACAQMLVYDVDGDGDADLLSTSAHQYGVWWTEQTPDGWTMHEIDRSISQTHALDLLDVNGDGLLDMVTGKRFWAHPHGDPGVDEPSMLCWYELSRDGGRPTWIRHDIHADSGVGLHFVLRDLDDDGTTDITCSNKKGVHVFYAQPAG